jgi:hypothetical protein
MGWQKIIIENIVSYPAYPGALVRLLSNVILRLAIS